MTTDGLTDCLVFRSSPTDDDAKAAPIPAIDLDEILDADFLASLAASLEGSDSSDSLMGSGEGSV